MWSMAALAAEAAVEQAAGLDDRRAALLHGRDEVALEPGLVVDRSAAFLPSTSAWKTSGYCVAEWLPQIVILVMSVTVAPALAGQLGHGPVVVEAGHGGEAAVGRCPARCSWR